MEKLKIDLKYPVVLQIIFVSLLLGSAILFFWMGNREPGYQIRIFGAKFDAQTSSVFLHILSIGVLLTAIGKFISLLAGLKIKNDFYLYFDDDRFTYPERKSFRFFKYKAHLYADLKEASIYNEKYSSGVFLHFNNGAEHKIPIANFLEKTTRLEDVVEQINKRLI